MLVGCRSDLPVSSGFGQTRRWSRRLIFRSVQVPEMLYQAKPCEGVGEICQVATKWGRRQIELRVSAIPSGGVVIPEYNFKKFT
jgi:hypothetical protein